MASRRASAWKSLLALAGATTSLPALAADLAPPPRSSDIIVTARRVEEPLHHVPISVTALDEDAIADLGAETLSDVARAVPNFIVVPVGVLAAEQPAIRGVFSPAGSSTVGLYIDDVPIQIRSLGFAGNADVRTFDVARVEVLRGPQGTLFGANSMGGTVRFITRHPDLAATDMRAGAELALTDGGGLSREFEGALGAPILQDRLGARAAVYYRLDAGYVDRVDRDTGEVVARNVNDISALAVRAGIRAALGDTVEVMPVIHYQRSRRDDYALFHSTLGPHRQENVNAQPGEDEFALPSLTINAGLGAVNLVSVTAWLDREDRQVTDYSTIFGELVMGGTVPGLVPEGGTKSFSRVTQRAFTHETRLESGDDGDLHWVVGGFVRRSRIHLTQSVVEPGIADLVQTYFGVPVEDVFGVPLLPGGVSYHGIEHVEENQFALFGEGRWRLTDDLEATMGLRATRSKLDLEVLSEGPYAGGVATVPDTGSQKETPVTPRFGLAWRPAPDQLLYVSVGKGFRIGGANAPVPRDPCAEDLRAFGRDKAPASFKSDSLWSYEAGAKASFDAWRSRIGLSVFQIDWDGIQQPVQLPTCGFSFVDNLGTARNRGFELEAETSPVPPLRLAAAVGFVDARFRTTILGGAPAGGEARAIIVERGDRVPYVPRWTARLSGEYRAGLGGPLTGYLRSEFQYASDYRRAPSEDAVGFDPRVDQGEGYGNLLARAGIEGGSWEVSAFAENLLNDRSVLFSSAEFVPTTGTPLRQMTLRPRTIGLAAEISF